MEKIEFKEIEFKYKADDISLEAFSSFCKNEPYKFVLAAGYDHFYSCKDFSESFCRHRVGPDKNELTFKRKTADKNNFVRTEHNIELSPSVSEEQVAALCNEFGYKHNVSIYKDCFVYKYFNHTFVYYICYNLEMKELGRFVEIEMDENYPWETEEQALNELTMLEKKFHQFGVSPQSRVKRSLFEMFRKDHDRL